MYKLYPKDDITALEVLEIMMWTLGKNYDNPKILPDVTCPDDFYKNLSDGVKRHFKKEEK